MKRYGTLLALAASIATAGTASAAGPMPTGFGFVPAHTRPVAGQRFVGVVVVDNEPQSQHVSRVRCDAQIGAERLRGRQRPYFDGQHQEATAIACSWRIPANAAGKTLRLWDYRFGRRVGVYGRSGLDTVSRSFSWLVRH